MQDPFDTPQKGNFFYDLLKFFFIFLLLLIAVFAVYASGILGDDPTPSDTTEDTPIQTLPTTTETTTEETTTETTSESSATTSQTPIETTYPPATVPGTPPVQSTTATIKTTETTDTTETTKPTIPTDEEMEEIIDVMILPINDNTRPDEKLWSVENIAVHYVGNPGTSAINNWKFFNNTNKANAVSAHFIIGLDGEIIQAVPLDEVAWAVGTYEGNRTSISIECCHPDSTGEFTQATYDSLVKLVSWLCAKFDLTRDDVLRHYDYTGKSCPKYWANDKDPASHERWEAFKDDLILE